MLAVLLLIAALLIPGVAMAADPSAIKSTEDAKAYFKPDGESLSKYATLPRDASSSTPPNQFSISICPESSSACSAGSPGAVRFTLSRVIKQDRQTGGKNVYDFVFTSSANSKLFFVYKKAEGDGFKDWGIVYGYNSSQNTGFEVPDDIGKPEGLDGTAWAQALEGHASEQGLEWCKNGGCQTAAITSDFLDAQQGGGDPFAVAVTKIAGIVGSLIHAIVQALLWAVNIGDLNNTPGLIEAWKVVRDLVNLLFVLVLLAAAILTIVRIDPRSYSIRSLLPTLVFAVIAVNFSLLFAGVMVNTAAVLSQPLLESVQAMVTQGEAIGGAGGDPAATPDLGPAVVALLAAVLVLLALLVLLIFFIARIVVIWLLAALSPLIFLFMVLPLTRGISKDLLKNWVNWVYLAPVAFLILYIGSRMLPGAAVESPGESGVTELIQALFFAAITIAAVAIPMSIGGRVLQAIGDRSMRAGKLGGKGGLAGAMMIPGVGEGVRTVQAGLKSRQTAQEDRAQERAIEAAGRLYSGLGEGRIGGAITGLDRSRAQRYRDALVEKEQKDQTLAGVGVDGAWRVVNYRDGRIDRSALSSEEQAIADSHVGELAAWKTVVESNLADVGHLSRYAQHGLHRNSNDPLISSVDKAYRGQNLAAHMDDDILEFGFKYPDAESYKKMSGDVWGRLVDPTFAAEHPEAFAKYSQSAYANIDTGSIGHSFNAADRARAAADKREKMGQAFDRMPSRVQRAMITANVSSMKDGEQHVALGAMSREEFARLHGRDTPPPADD